MLHGFVLVLASSLCAFAFVPSSVAAGPNVRGKVTALDKLVPDVYAEAAKPDSKRWSWREPSPAVSPAHRHLSPNASRDIVVAATNNGQNPALSQPLLVRVTGGRTIPATLVIPPGTQLQFRNDDPFPHKLKAEGQDGWNGAMDTRGTIREWKAPSGEQLVVIRDDLAPSVRTYIKVLPGVVQTTYPGRDMTFGMTLPPGDYVLKAFFGGKKVGKDVGITAKEKGTLEIKEPINLGEGG
ncbi:MAG: hypothetical protein U0174_12200 [Polyangiaceae bacterium]